ncbi:MAG: hypothetical protein JWQ23_2945 [Herminiimonas sp.]|nr:hypothetical protein [Herminiimonas sp.]
MSRLSSFALCIVLGGCASESELAAQKQREVDHMVRVYGPACNKLGYTPDTDPWRNCIVQLDITDRLDRPGYPLTASCYGRFRFGHCTNF